MTRLILEKNNYRVLEAGTGPEAVAIFAQQMDAIDLVITDMMLPYMDGVAVIRAIKKMRPDLTFVVSSGHGDDVRATDLHGLGVTQTLAKPYDTSKVLRVVHDALTRQEG